MNNFVEWVRVNLVDARPHHMFVASRLSYFLRSLPANIYLYTHRYINIHTYAHRYIHIHTYTHRYIFTHTHTDI